MHSNIHVAEHCRFLFAWRCLLRDVKGTSYLLVSLGLNAVVLLFVGLGRFATLPQWLASIAFLLPYASFLLLLPYVSFLTFVLFVRRIGVYFERRDILHLTEDVLNFAGIAAVLVALPWMIVKFHLNPIPIDEGGQGVVFIFSVSLGWTVTILICVVLSFLRYVRMLELARRATLKGAPSHNTLAGIPQTAWKNPQYRWDHAPVLRGSVLRSVFD